MFEQVGDPAGAIDEQRSGGWFAPHFLQLLQDFPKALRRQLILAPAPLRYQSRLFGRSLSLRPHFNRDAKRLERKPVTLGAGFKYPGEQDARLTCFDGDADDHRTSLVRPQSEARQRRGPSCNP